MPEGPSIVIAVAALKKLKGRTVKESSGSIKTIEPERLIGKKITAIRSFGKHLLLSFGSKLTLRVHFMMFGSYRLNDDRPGSPRLHLNFDDGTVLNFYACSLQFIEDKLDQIYDWTSDIMNPLWNENTALKKLKVLPDNALICDALLDQDIFAGLGNIIKNEVLFRTHTQPLSLVKAIPAKKLREILKDAVTYAQLFLEWKKEFVLKKHWEAYSKKVCPRDGHQLEKLNTGIKKRRSFWCTKCQVLYK